jgi:hypothetical protein
MNCHIATSHYINNSIHEMFILKQPFSDLLALGEKTVTLPK